MDFDQCMQCVSYVQRGDGCGVYPPPFNKPCPYQEEFPIERVQEMNSYWEKKKEDNHGYIERIC